MSLNKIRKNEEEVICIHPEHYPPPSIFLMGKGTYENTCPECEEITIVTIKNGN